MLHVLSFITTRRCYLFPLPDLHALLVRSLLCMLLRACSVLLGLCLASMSHRLDDAAVVSALLQQWGAPASVLTRLQATGFTTLGLLGHALPSPDAEDFFLCTVLELDPADSAQLPPPVCAACLRMHKTFVLLSTRPHQRPRLSHRLHPPSRASLCCPKCRPRAKSFWPVTRVSSSHRILCPRRSSCQHYSTPLPPVRPRGCPGAPAAPRRMP